MNRDGWTLIEVLVAATILTLFVMASSAAFTTAARLQLRAAQVTARTAALEPFVIAAGSELLALPHCGAEVDTATPEGVCTVSSERCSTSSLNGVVDCDGGWLLRARIRTVGDSANRLPPGGVEWRLEVWAVAP